MGARERPDLTGVPSRPASLAGTQLLASVPPATQLWVAALDESAAAAVDPLRQRVLARGVALAGALSAPEALRQAQELLLRARQSLPPSDAALPHVHVLLHAMASLAT